MPDYAARRELEEKLFRVTENLVDLGEIEVEVRESAFLHDLIQHGVEVMYEEDRIGPTDRVEAAQGLVRIISETPDMELADPNLSVSAVLSTGIWPFT